MEDEILISYLLGEASPGQAAQVNEWREQDKAHNARYEQFKIIWETSHELKFNGEVDAQASLQRLKQKAADAEAHHVKIVALNPVKLWLKIAAAVIILIGVMWIYFSLHSVRQVQFATTREVRVDTLSDGSVITLNKATILDYPEKFTGKQRNVTLAKGEAFFSVAHNKAMPFVISTGGATIRVVGTSFNVKNKDDNVEVIVETGIVQVSRNGNTVLLRPGEKVLVQQNVPALVKENTPDHLYTYYRSKEFVADNTPLWRMVQVLNEAYDSNIVIGKKELNDLPLNTTFKNESLDDILEVISHTFKITVEKKQDSIILK
jgi:transmembrane sensor